MHLQAPNHKLVLPVVFLFLRVAQAVIAVIVLGLTAFLISVHYGILVPGSYGVAMFTSIVTLIIVAYNIIADRAVPAIYNMWAILALDIFAVIFWLSTMAAIAAYRAGYGLDFYYNYRRDLDKRYVSSVVYLGVLVGVSILAAKAMILFLITLVIFGIRLFRHQKNNNSGGVMMQPQQQFQPQYQQSQVQPEQFQPQYQQSQVQPEQVQPQYQQSHVQAQPFQPPYQHGQMPPHQQYQQTPAKPY